MGQKKAHKHGHGQHEHAHKHSVDGSVYYKDGVPQPPQPPKGDTIKRPHAKVSCERCHRGFYTRYPARVQLFCPVCVGEIASPQPARLYQAQAPKEETGFGKAVSVVLGLVGGALILLGALGTVWTVMVTLKGCAVG